MNDRFDFTMEEIHLIASILFNREQLLDTLRDIANGGVEAEDGFESMLSMMQSVAQTAAEKVEKMTDKEFINYRFIV